ncbi:MAG: hypothetical protein WBO10_08965 [Pyrinomonadaceae bacterium]
MENGPEKTDEPLSLGWKIVATVVASGAALLIAAALDKLDEKANPQPKPQTNNGGCSIHGLVHRCRGTYVHDCDKCLVCCGDGNFSSQRCAECQNWVENDDYFWDD